LISVPGELISPDDLAGRRAREIAGYLKAAHSPFLRIFECRRLDNTEIIVLDIDVEVAPRRPVKIARTEPVMLFCGVDGTEIPSVIPLREDFPSDQLHITIHEGSDYVSLCLWETPAEDLKARFTPFMFLARIKQWLELAADGKLHQPDQGAEPVLMGTDVQAIVPFGPLDSKKRYIAVGQEGPKNRTTIHFVEPDRKLEQRDQAGTQFVLIPVTTNSVYGRAVRSAPRTLNRLAEMLAERGCDLVQAVTQFVTAANQEAGIGNALPIILVNFPKTSSPEGEVVGEELWAFGITESVSELGKAIGAYDSAGGFTAALIGPKPAVDELPALSIEPMLVLRELEASSVSLLSGMTGGEELKCLAVGVGAIGSKVVEICARGGYGRWTVMDMDTFLPHNAVRHILGEWAIGEPKAPHVRGFLNQVIPGERIVDAIVEDVTDVDNLSDKAKRALRENDVIVDMSASVAVARCLTLQDGACRCVSMFFNPGATDLVLLSEDQEKTRSLLDLEASYYAALIDDERLRSHLYDPDSQAIRYGNGCRDVTAQIGPDQVSILSGLAVKGLRQCLAAASETAKVWKSHPDGSIEVVDLPTSTYRGEAAGDWDVRWSDSVIERLSSERQADLPNETGGILLGVADFERRLIRICAAIEAPPDSVKRPHYFERGKTGLEQKLKEVGLVTAGQIRYLGEWHSHPKGVAARPSSDDDALFSALGKLFGGTGEPHIMAIISDNEIFWRLGINELVHDAVMSSEN